jgi:hypothetical protein
MVARIGLGHGIPVVRTCGTPRVESLETALQWVLVILSKVDPEYLSKRGGCREDDDSKSGYHPDASNRQTQPTFLPRIHSSQQGMFPRLPEKICPKDRKHIERFFKIAGSSFLSELSLNNTRNERA